MPSFPSLKTNAVAQYPATKVLRFQNHTVRFMDGTEQRYRDCTSVIRRWEIRLDQLDEGEMAALDEFFAASEGAFGSFTFTDPWDGQLYPNCSFVDALDLTSIAEMSGTTSLTVTENRG